MGLRREAPRSPRPADGRTLRCLPRSPPLRRLGSTTRRPASTSPTTSTERCPSTARPRFAEALRRRRQAAVVSERYPGLSYLESIAVRAPTRRVYQKLWTEFMERAGAAQWTPLDPACMGDYHTEVLDEWFFEGRSPDEAAKLISAAKHVIPALRRQRPQRLPRAERALAAWRKAVPPRQRVPLPCLAVTTMVCYVTSVFKRPDLGAKWLIEFDTYFRPGELDALTIQQIVPQNAGQDQPLRRGRPLRRLPLRAAPEVVDLRAPARRQGVGRGHPAGDRPLLQDGDGLRLERAPTVSIQPAPCRRVTRFSVSATPAGRDQSPRAMEGRQLGAPIRQSFPSHVRAPRSSPRRSSVRRARSAAPCSDSRRNGRCARVAAAQRGTARQDLSPRRPPCVPFGSISLKQRYRGLQNLFARESRRSRCSGRSQIVLLLGPHDPHLVRALRSARLGVISLDAARGPITDASAPQVQCLVEGCVNANCVGAMLCTSLFALGGPDGVEAWSLKILRWGIRMGLPVIVRGPISPDQFDALRHAASRQCFAARWHDFGCSHHGRSCFSGWHIGPLSETLAERLNAAHVSGAPLSRSPRFLPPLLAQTKSRAT